ncbi:hypothetical protein [Streptomyces sp. MUM 178J]|uniref:hypothetical protein n=1 Tax=Streptomyces sp. MUM 178J TaxID=2791991 RepID=UPI001F0376F4|nr:hypothetical protein [Streptomyces sp. MUM 178J]WRQ78160.1 hypothetical protein I3F59_001480 [Streptomyces sp. MUM 178J]
MKDPRAAFMRPPEPESGPPQSSPPEGEQPAADGVEHSYSATVLASHWVERPAVRPDRVEGSVLRFGPGVTAAVRPQGDRDVTAVLWRGEPAPPPERPRPSRLATAVRRYTLALVVLLAVLGYLAWQRYGAPLAVQNVSVRTDPQGPSCGGTADVTALVTTNGRPGTLTYRWVRNDGTASGELTEQLARGQRETRLHLLWSFEGTGDFRAEAELRILSPERRTAAAGFVYRCP